MARIVKVNGEVTLQKLNEALKELRSTLLDEVTKTASNAESLVAGTLPLVGARVYRTAAQAIPDNSVTVVTWTAVAHDTDSFWRAATPTRLTVPPGKAGYYLIQAQGNWAAVATRQLIDIQCNSNGTSNVNNMLARHDVQGGLAQNTGVIKHLKDGDVIELFVYQDSTGAMNFGTLGPTYHGSPWLALTRLGT